MDILILPPMITVIIAIIGGVTGSATAHRRIARQSDGSYTKPNFIVMLINITSSIFLAIMSYYIMKEYGMSEHLASSLAGLVAFMGADFVDRLLQKKILG